MLATESTALAIAPHVISPARNALDLLQISALPAIVEVL